MNEEHAFLATFVEDLRVLVGGGYRGVEDSPQRNGRLSSGHPEPGSACGTRTRARVNAVHEAAHQIMRLVSLGDSEAGTTVVPSMISGGTASNTVPAAATVAVDVRTWSEPEQMRVDGAIHGLEPVLDGARLAIFGGAHAATEHVRLDMLLQRIDLIEGIIKRVVQTPASISSAIRSPTMAVGQAGVDLGI